MTDRVLPPGSSNDDNGESPTGNVGESRNETSQGSLENLIEHPNPDPGTEYHLTFTDSVKAAIVRAVQKAYDIVQERHDVDLGFNAQTFGHNVYHIGKFQLEQCCKLSGGKLQCVEEIKSLFRFKGGDYTLGFYKVAERNIWSAFPTSENGATTVDPEGQLILAGLEDAMLDRVDDLRYVVVAHMGKPTHGLKAVYLCIPIQTAGGKIVRWGYTEPIYLAERDSSTPPPPLMAPPPETPIPPAEPQEELESEVVVTAKESD